MQVIKELCLNINLSSITIQRSQQDQQSELSWYQEIQSFTESQSLQVLLTQCEGSADQGFLGALWVLCP